MQSVSSGNALKGFARHGSAIFLKQEKGHHGITERRIFWVWLVYNFAMVAAALAIVIIFFQKQATIPDAIKLGSTMTQPPTANVSNGDGPCAYGHCTGSPTPAIG